MKMQFEAKNKQESQLIAEGLRDASCQLKSCHATVQKLLVRLVNNNNNDRLTAFDPGQPG